MDDQKGLVVCFGIAATGVFEKAALQLQVALEKAFDLLGIQPVKSVVFPENHLGHIVKNGFIAGIALGRRQNEKALTRRLREVGNNLVLIQVTDQNTGSGRDIADPQFAMIPMGAKRL